MQFVWLETRGVIGLSGEEARCFLQGLLSGDIYKATSGNAVYAALLTPQGRFLHDFFVLEAGEALWLDAQKSRQDDAMQRLERYKLRSKVAIKPVHACVAAAAWGEGAAALLAQSPPGDVVAVADPRLAELGVRLYGGESVIRAWLLQNGACEEPFAAYDRMRLRLGVPDGGRDMTVDKALLLEYGIDALCGVDFTKGCYVGQEVTARMRYRGGLRKRLYKVEALEGDLPAPDEAIYFDAQRCGEMRSSHDNVGLALLRIEEAQKAQAQNAPPLVAGRALLRATLPAWAGRMTAESGA